MAKSDIDRLAETLKENTRALKEQHRVLVAINTNLAELGRILKEDKEVSDGSG